MFDRKNKKAMKTAWAVIAVLVAVSMVLLYMPALFT
jgi:predicted nucleic acid-binding Zn ribbon protein